MERDVAGDGEGAEGCKVATVFEGNQGEGYQNEKDGFLVNMPAEEE